MLDIWTHVIEPIAMRLPFEARPSPPVVLLGFGKSGKSLLASALRRSGLFALYPTEGNLRLFMPGLYPWHASSFEGPPLWRDPLPTQRYLRALYTGPQGTRIRRAVGIYQAIKRKPVVIDNGNLTYWLDSLLRLFPGARLVSAIRDPHDAVPEVARNLRRKMDRHGRYGMLPRLSDDALLETLALRWVETWHVIRDLERDARTIVVHFDDLCREPGAAMAEVFAWLGHPEAQGSPMICLTNSNVDARAKRKVAAVLQAVLQEEEWSLSPLRTQLAL